jgi:hypothetical protein
MNTETAEKNIREFMEKHGVEGFLKIYFAKYLFKMVISELKSKLGSKLSTDPGTIFYYKGNKIENLSDIHKYEKELYEECKKKTDEIITQFKKDKKFNDLFKGDIEKLNDALLEKHFQKKLHEILESWKEED